MYIDNMGYIYTHTYICIKIFSIKGQNHDVSVIEKISW